MNHADGVTLVEIELSRLGCMVARHFVGRVVTEGGGVRLLGVKGHADLSGTTGTGRALAVEVKVGRDRVKPGQSRWRAAWTDRGGIYAVSRPDQDGWQAALAEKVAA